MKRKARKFNTNLSADNKYCNDKNNKTGNRRDRQQTGFIVGEVLPGSIGEEAGIGPGDEVLAVNEVIIKDIFDYKFLIADTELELLIKKNDGALWKIAIEKDTYEDLGIEFIKTGLEDIRKCNNNCIFCFINQLPKGMRESLYIKDDDTRLSFLMGNYVTLTNVNNKEIERIIRYRMSPINISVHTVNSSLREFMMKNRFAGSILNQIKKLTEGGITVNCQIVLCRGINDGKELDKTILNLSNLYPGVESISVVPVGITKYREGLYKLLPYDELEASNVLAKINKWQKILLREKGSRIVFPSDEFYVLAKSRIPEYEEYEDFPQLENGVGLVSLFKHDFYEYLFNLEKSKEINFFKTGSNRVTSIATGLSAYEFIKELAKALEKRYNNLKINVYPIENIFFGEHVTVSGLLTGQDIIRALKNKELGQNLLIPASMLRAGENLFLDNCTVDMVEKSLKTKIDIVEVKGKNFVDVVLGI